MASKGETRAVDVLTRVRADILSCRLEPGAKLRFEPLKERYEVSFSTLREALSRLAEEGLAVSEGQRGFSVAPVSVDDLIDLTNARVLLDRELIRLSMLNGDDSWEAGILSIYHRMERLQERLGDEYSSDEEWIQLHSKYHVALVSACGSPLLLQIRQKLFDRAHRYRRIAAEFRTKWRPKEAEHKAIRDLVLDRNPAAVDLIERHIRETTDNVLNFASHLFPDDVSTQAA
ncbi:FCD domain-containing protein [Thioclava sp. BHET1]|nr:FCD domain-containing protein [Thioclava sp. BHET1]